jgi:hypothetical protein
MYEAQPIRRNNRNEVHVINEHNGHVVDTDCWCEPYGYWHTNAHGIVMFIVEHTDGIQKNHHKTILSLRELDPDFITKLLNSIYFFEHER